MWALGVSKLFLTFDLLLRVPVISDLTIWLWNLSISGRKSPSGGLTFEQCPTDEVLGQHKYDPRFWVSYCKMEEMGREDQREIVIYRQQHIRIGQYRLVAKHLDNQRTSKSQDFANKHGEITSQNGYPTASKTAELSTLPSGESAARLRTCKLITVAMVA